MTPVEFLPPRGLRSPHLQTVLASSVVRRARISREAQSLIATSERVLLPCRDGIRLTADVARNGDGPLITLIHGWLGDSASSYLLATAAQLYSAGYSIARLHLRDHGASEHLNAEMFHSARIDEVVDACNWLANVYAATDRIGLVGFSLGANFALRVAGHAELTAFLAATVAICPVIQPGPTMRAIDAGWFAYRRYFVRKWHRALAAKQRAFPELALDRAFELDRVGSLTEYFVEHHTPYPSAQAYFDAYAIDDARIHALRTPTWIWAADDDPVIPAATFDGLPRNEALHVDRSPHGGHCGFLTGFALQSAVGDYTAARLRAVGLSPARSPVRV